MVRFKLSLLICNVKILLLHQHFNTPEKGGALRSYFLAKALADHGMQVVVITAHNQGAKSVAAYEGIEIHYLPVPYDNAFSFYKRISAFMAFLVKSARLGSSLQGINKCYAMSTPLTTGLAAVWIKWKRKTPFLFEVGDLWPDAPVQLGFVKNSVLKIFLYQLEKFIYRQSESIVALSAPMQEIIRRKAPGKTVHLLPNMADTDFFTTEKRNALLDEKFGVKDHFVISYIGSIGYANGLEHLLDCAREVQKIKLPVVFLICGEGAMLPYLKETVQKLSISNVIFVPFQNREGAREVMNVTDAVFVSYRQHAVLETGSPNKYFDGLAAGKLIIVNFGGWIKEEIEKMKCGIGLNPNRSGQLALLFETVLNDARKVQAMKENAAALAKKYDRKTQSIQFAKLFKPH
jgi:glycosyltransferase involved in cell wall biosynthesis